MLLYDGAVRIPLVIAGPGVAAADHPRPVSIVDVAPTLLRLAGIAVPGGMQGRDLLAAPGDGHEVYAETLYPRTLGWSPLAALVEDRWKVISAEGAGEELYDLQNDPAERENASGRKPDVVRAAIVRLAAIRGAEAAPASAVPSPDAQERLRALGYIGTAPPPAPSGRGGANPAARIAVWASFEDALAKINAGSTAAALATLAALHAANPDAQVIAATYASALSGQGRHRQALAIYRKAVRSWPGDSMLFHDLAVAAQRAGLRDEAMRAERASLALDPRNGAAHNGLGLLLIEANRVDEAKQAFTLAAAADSSSAEYLANLGNARRATGDRAGAEAAYRSALVSDPRAANALNGLGALLVETGKPLEAIPLLERAAASDANLWEARLNLGIAHQTAGHLAAAAAAYRAVLAAPPRFSRERQAARELLASIGRHN
jgi:tetratricopeptide (TPR) repeat protein